MASVREMVVLCPGPQTDDHKESCGKRIVVQVVDGTGQVVGDFCRRCGTIKARSLSEKEAREKLKKHEETHGKRSASGEQTDD